LVIVKQNFSGADEVELTAVLLGRFPTMPVLLFYGQASFELVKNALHAGASDCLFAPLRAEEIIRVVKNSIMRSSRVGDWTRRQVKITTASLQRRVDELQKFDTILENIEDGVVIVDDNLNILLINASMRRMFGLWQEDDVNGKPAIAVIRNPDLRALFQVHKGGLATVSHHEIELDDGHILSAQSGPVPGIGIAVTVQDITYLRKVDRLKNEFINTVSHDLRSPLTAIMGYVDLLERVGPVNKKQLEFIRRIQASVESVTSLVNDLLELGRIESGFDSQNEVIHLDKILHQSLETMDSLIVEKHLNLLLDLPEKVPPMHGNPIRLRQLFDNLIGNAIKYTPELGDISIELSPQTEQIFMRISDTGPGIPPGDQPHIFDKFYRGSNVLKGVDGSGLGLAIVKSIVDSHLGRIWVESSPGQGTIFTIVFPLVQAKAD
jgi:two-component system phosphate regulon sensor histidine kinase PhoR